MNIKPLFCINLLKLLSSLLLCLFSLQLHAQWQTEDAAIMGTTIRVEVWHEDAAIRQKGIDNVLEEMERVNRLMSPYI